VALTALLLVVGIAPTAGAATLEFADGDATAEIVVPRASPAATGETGVLIVNTTNEVDEADVRLADLTPPSGSAKVTAPTFVRVGQAGRQELTIKFDGGPAVTPPGVYMSELTVSSRGGARETVRKDVRVRVLSPARPAQVPLTDTRWNPSEDGFDGSATAAGLLPESQGSATLSDGEGDTALVDVSTRPDETTGSTAVTVSGDATGTGTFRGLVPLAGGGAVDLTVRYEDGFIWVLTALLLGVALAVLAERFIRGGPGEIRSLAMSGISALSNSESLARQLKSQLEGLAQSPRTDATQDPRGRRALAAIERDLKALDTALKRASGMYVPEPFSEAIATSPRTRELREAAVQPFLKPEASAAGGADVTLEELRRQQRAVAQALSVAEAWPALREMLRETRAVLSTMLDGAGGPEAPRALRQATARFDALVWQLVNAESAADVDPEAMRRDIRELQETVAMVEAHLDPDAKESPNLPVLYEPSAAAQAIDGGALVVRQDPWLPVVQQRQRARQVGSILTGLLTIALGLIVLYLDNPFTSLGDYLTGILWGLGGKILLDGLATVGERVATRGAPG
jgi:hypothetical protein